MSKWLILIRHAKSSWDQSSLTDKERPLNRRGEHAAPIVGQWLHDYCHLNQIHSINFLVSTATRTQQTLKLLSDSLGDIKSSIDSRDDMYLANAQTLDKYIKSHSDNSNCLALIAHNPGIHLLVEHYIGEQFDKFPTCAIACFQFDSNKWLDINPENCITSEIKTPKQLQM